MKNIFKNMRDKKMSELLSGHAASERYTPATRHYFFRYER